MKKLLFVLFLMPSCLFAQSYSETVEVQGENAATLYTKAKEWFVETFNGKGDQAPTEDKTNGKLTGRGSATSLIYTNDVAINMILTYALKVSVKDGQYKYEFENIMVEHGKKFPLTAFKSGTTVEGTKELFKISGMKSPSKKMIDQNIDYNTRVIKQVDIELNRIIDSLAEKMKN
jgi:hypothetical protein